MAPSDRVSWQSDELLARADEREVADLARRLAQALAESEPRY